MTDFLNLTAKVLIAPLFLLALIISFNLGKTADYDSMSVVRDYQSNIFYVLSFDESRTNSSGNLEYKNIQIGTGFLIKHNNEHLLVTNNHVCGNIDKELDEKRFIHGFTGDIGPESADEFIEFTIIARDKKSDLCLARPHITIHPDLGLTISDVDTATAKRGTIGYNGINLLVGQVGYKLGSHTIKSTLYEIDHELAENGRKINNLNLHINERRSLCPSGKILHAEPHPIALMFPPDMAANFPPILYCFYSATQDLYDFFTVGGASGSPVIDLKTGHVVGVIARYEHDPRSYGGAVPLSEVKRFIENK